MDGLFDKIGLIKPPEKSHLEIEVRFFIDERKKDESITHAYTSAQAERLAKELINKYKSEPKTISQTINFINDSNVKQMVFHNGEQQKDKLTHYRKDKIIKPMTLTHNVLPSYRFSASFETEIEEFSVSKAQLARIRLRYTINLGNWQLDITLVKNVSDFSNPVKLKSAKTAMLFPIDINNFIEKAPWSFADIFEFELEYIGEAPFSEASLLEVDKIFEKTFILADELVGDSSSGPSNNSTNDYQQKIYEVAKLVRQKDAYKFQKSEGIKQLSNQVIELDKNMFLADVLKNITNYYITDKIDGSRAILYIKDRRCYVITKDLKSFDIDISGTYIFDSEEYKDEYYLFDVLVFDGVNLTNKPFQDRLAYLEKFNIPKFQNKLFERLTSDFQNQVAKFKNRKVPYETDGIILTPANETYFDMKVYKYKPIDKLTIDFLIKKCPSKLLGISPYIDKPGKTLYLLFSGMRHDTFNQLNLSFVRNYEDIFPGIDKRHLPKYFPYQFQPSNFTFAYLYWDSKDSLDGEVGEFVCGPCVKNLAYSVGDDLWVLKRLREDRKIEVARGNYFGNNYKVAELTWMSYNEPLVIEDLKISNYFQENDSQLQKASRNFNSYVKAQIFEQFKNTDWVMDLASGKGQDLFRYSSYGFKNVVFLEIDNVALLELVNRKHQLHKTNSINIQLHQMDLTANYVDNIERLSDIDVQKVDLIVCNFAFHYMLENKKSLLNVAKFINHYLKPGGRFIFTAFDGKEIIKLLNENKGEWTVKQDSAIKYSIKKQYSVNFLDPIGQKIDVLLPFSNDSYYSEYLVNIDYIVEEFSKLGFALEIDQTFGEYLDGYKKSNYHGFTALDDNDKKYVSLYHYYCLYKKKGK